MLTRFGDGYRAYQRRVPMFIPRWGQGRKLAGTSSNTRDEPGVH